MTPAVVTGRLKTCYFHSKTAGIEFASFWEGAMNAVVWGIKPNANDGLTSVRRAACDVSKPSRSSSTKFDPFSVSDFLKFWGLFWVLEII